MSGIQHHPRTYVDRVHNARMFNCSACSCTDTIDQGGVIDGSSYCNDCLEEFNQQPKLSPVKWTIDEARSRRFAHGNGNGDLVFECHVCREIHTAYECYKRGNDPVCLECATMPAEPESTPRDAYSLGDKPAAPLIIDSSAIHDKPRKGPLRRTPEKDFPKEVSELGEECYGCTRYFRSLHEFQGGFYCDECYALSKPAAVPASKIEHSPTYVMSYEMGFNQGLLRLPRNYADAEDMGIIEDPDFQKGYLAGYNDALMTFV